MAAAIVLQTQDNAPPGLLGVWAERRGVELDVLGLGYHDVTELQRRQVLRALPRVDFKHEIIQVAIQGDYAEVVECLVDDALVVDQADGKVRNNSVLTSKILRKLQRVDNMWRISEDGAIEQHQGVVPCGA